MDADGTKRSNVTVGMHVKINPQNDKSRKILVEGEVDEILTSVEVHPHGILVKTKDGSIGRIKEIISKNKLLNIDSKQPEKKNIISILDLVKNGEDHFVEFKTSILWSKFKTKEEIEKSNSYELKRYGQNTSKYIIAKSLCGFLNSDGGVLIIGVKEIKDSDEIQIVGIQSEFGKLKDKTQDGYRRMIIDEVVKPYLPSNVLNHFNNYFEFIFENIDGNTVLGINVNPADSRVFVEIANDSIFFVRIDASTRQLSGPELVDFCARRFK